jgi:hypothetical protein
MVNPLKKKKKKKKKKVPGQQGVLCDIYNVQISTEAILL